MRASAFTTQPFKQPLKAQQRALLSVRTSQLIDLQWRVTARQRIVPFVAQQSCCAVQGHWHGGVVTMACTVRRSLIRDGFPLQVRSCATTACHAMYFSLSLMKTEQSNAVATVPGTLAFQVHADLFGR
jgi:hypothetical protein